MSIVIRSLSIIMSNADNETLSTKPYLYLGVANANPSDHVAVDCGHAGMQDTDGAGRQVGQVQLS